MNAEGAVLMFFTVILSPDMFTLCIVLSCACVRVVRREILKNVALNKCT